MVYRGHTASARQRGIQGSDHSSCKRGTLGAGGVAFHRRQTIVPPSIHETGEAIVWERFEDPAHVDINDLRKAVRSVAVASLLARHWPGTGSRQDTALALAGGLLRAGCTEEGTRRFIEAVATAAGDEEVRMRLGVVEATARKLAGGENIRGWPSLIKLLGRDGPALVAAVCDWLGIRPTPKRESPTKPGARLPPPYRPFPVDALPEPVRTFVIQEALALGCDEALLVLPALSVMASLIGNSRVIRLKRTWTEPSVIWTGVVSDSGTLKSPAQNLIVAPIRKVQRRLIQEYREAMLEYEQELAKWEKAKKSNKENPGPRPEKPTCKRLVCSDVTVERLAGILHENPKGVLVCWDEFGGWLGSFNQYKKKGGSDLAGWLQMHRAETLIVDRKTGDTPLLYVARAATSICGGIQPGALARALTPEFLEVGLGARVAMAMPPKRPKRWTEMEVDPDVQQAWEKLVQDLQGLTPDVGDDFD